MVFKLWKHKAKKFGYGSTMRISRSSEIDLFSPEDLDTDSIPTLRRSRKFYHILPNDNFSYSWEHVEDIEDLNSGGSKGVGIFRSIGNVVEMETRSYVSDADNFNPSDFDRDYSLHATQGTDHQQVMADLSLDRTSTTATPEEQPSTPTQSQSVEQLQDREEAGICSLDNHDLKVSIQEVQLVRPRAPCPQSPPLAPSSIPDLKALKLDNFTFEKPPSPQHKIKTNASI